MPVQSNPCGNRLIVTVEPMARRSAIIEEVRLIEELSRIGRVVAIGPEVRDVRVGDRVLVSITAGVELPVGTLVEESAVMGVYHAEA